MVGLCRRFRRSALVAAALAAFVSGCAGVGATDPARLRQEAAADLQRWGDAVGAAGGAGGPVIVGDFTGQVGDWELAVGDNNKPALMAGLIEAVSPLSSAAPPDGLVTWQDGSTRTVHLLSAADALSAIEADAAGSSCPDCTPLLVTGATLGSVTAMTSRGEAQVPAWEFSIEGTAVLVTRVAIAGALKVVPPVSNPSNAPVGISIDSALISKDGLHLTATFVGAPLDAGGSCGADYTAEAAESDTAVVVMVFEHPHWSIFPAACSAVGAYRTAVADLATPLGGRSVLEVTQGLPVEVTPAP